ncbi:MAG: hypothetical protein ACYDDQ_01985 [Vulcanimicrobiaceae bacterium]
MEITIRLSCSEVGSLNEALTLADTLVSESEYGDDRHHKAQDLFALRGAWKVCYRLSEARSQALKARQNADDAGKP